MAYIKILLSIWADGKTDLTCVGYTKIYEFILSIFCLDTFMLLLFNSETVDNSETANAIDRKTSVNRQKPWIYLKNRQYRMNL